LAIDDHAYALLPERRRAKVLVVSDGNTYLEAALLLDEYLDVTQVTPRGYADAIAKERWDAVLFDRVTPAEQPKAHALYLDPRGPGSPVKVLQELKQPGFDKVDRNHPAVRFVALDAVNIAVGHKLVPETGDKVLGASDAGASPLLVAGTRGGYKFVALGFDVTASDLPLRPGWPLFVVNCIGWFSDEDAEYLSSYRTGEVWRIPMGGGVAQATLKRPDGGTERVPVYDGHAVVLGQEAGFYELAGGGHTSSFAANLLDASESAILPRDGLVVDGRPSSEVAGFAVGVRQEMWIYLLLAAVLLTALEWATYHRRITV
jgi:hypothetical protein